MSKNGYNDYFQKKRQGSAPNQRESQPVRKPAKKDWTEDIEKNFMPIKPKKNQINRRAMPRGAVFAALVLASVGILGYFAPDQLDHLIGRIKITVGDSARAQVAENKSPTTGPNTAKTATDSVTAAGPVCDPQKSYSDEEISHFSKLSERKNELDLRESDLNALEEELHKQRREVEARMDKLEAIREEVAGILKDRVDVDQQRVDKLVEFYSNMKPKQAAEVFGKLNEDLAVEVLGKMKKKNAADIMNLLEPAKARVLSEKFAGYQRK